MMSNEGAPNNKEIKWEEKKAGKTGIQREEIGVVEGAEERVREKSPILIREQILDQKEEVEKGQDSTICPLLDLFA